MLIKSVVYEHGKKIAEIELGQIREYLSRPKCFIWVALSEPSPETLNEMQQQFGLHPLAVEDACHGHQRPKINEFGDSLFVVIHTIETDGSTLRVGEVDIFTGPDYVLSVRRGVEKGFQDVRVRCEREPELLSHGSCYILYALVDAVVDRYFPILDKLESELESIEERIFAINGSPRETMEALYSLKQRLMTLKHAVAPLLEAVSNLSGARVPALLANLRDYFRDIYDHLQRLNQTIESTRDTIGTAISVNLSMITLQENETMKRLAAYAALIAVPTLIVGVYGMNFEHMPELSGAMATALSSWRWQPLIFTSSPGSGKPSGYESSTMATAEGTGQARLARKLCRTVRHQSLPQSWVDRLPFVRASCVVVAALEFARGGVAFFPTNDLAVTQQPRPVLMLH